MNPELKTKWLAALRSGDYLQGRAVLRNRDRYCCLGVLCDLVDDTKWGEDEDGGFVYIGSFDDAPCTTMPPDRIYDTAGIDLDIAHDLATSNDNGDTFEQIAEWIEEHL